MFQFALPRGERRQLIGADEADCTVSIRAPARGATLSFHFSVAATVFQFALPRGERRWVWAVTLIVALVSIRAPARGATFGVGGAVAGFGVSIRAPARGATTSARILSLSLTVSIRAPARGATSAQAADAGGEGRFNSRSREGSDQRVRRPRLAHVLFQFALPRGERRQHNCDTTASSAFQFALPRGERHYRHWLPLREGTRFNSRSREGSDARRLPLPSRVSRFNSRSREGSDKSMCAS